jgi:FAD binding domain
MNVPACLRFFYHTHARDLPQPCSIFHSTAGFPCPYSSSLTPAPAGMSANAPSTIAVVTENFNAVLKHDAAAATVRVQAGLQVLALLRWAEAHDLTTEVGAPTNYAELTLGGVLSANGHGTGSNVTSSMVRWTCTLISINQLHINARPIDDNAFQLVAVCT